LDADALPEPLAAPSVCQAMEVLKMFSQDRMERELYEGRLKARRDAQARTNEIERTQAELQRTQAEMERTQAEMERRAGALTRERDEARGVARNLLLQHIQMCQRVLEQAVSDSSELEQHDDSALQALADRLVSEIEGRS
jgi:hypothetical protein